MAEAITTEEVKEPQETEEDGKIKQDVFDSYKNDMHKYKEQRNELKAENEKLKLTIQTVADKDKKDEETKLLEQEKYKELLDKRDKELVDMNTKFKTQRIDNALRVKALELGINNADDIVLIDKTDVSINEETGIISGVEDALKKLKESRSYLFVDTKPNVDTGHAGNLATITWQQLMDDTKLAMKIKNENPDLYTKLKTGN